MSNVDQMTKKKSGEKELYERYKEQLFDKTEAIIQFGRQLCCWVSITIHKNHYFKQFCIIQKISFNSYEGKKKDGFFKDTSHHLTRKTKTVLNKATPHLITDFFGG